MKQIILGLFIAGVAGMGFAHAQDADAGKRVFARCLSCHKVGEGAANAVGPELNGIIGRAAGSVEGFAYSDAMKGSGITWDEASLHEFLTDPKAKVPGTKMAFPGLKNEKQLNDLLAYLGTFNADGTTK
jgi:cytochrome c